MITTMNVYNDDHSFHYNIVIEMSTTDKSDESVLLAGLKSDAEFILVADDGWKGFCVSNVLITM